MDASINGEVGEDIIIVSASRSRDLRPRKPKLIALNRRKSKLGGSCSCHLKYSNTGAR